MPSPSSGSRSWSWAAPGSSAATWCATLLDARRRRVSSSSTTSSPRSERTCPTIARGRVHRRLDRRRCASWPMSRTSSTTSSTSAPITATRARSHDPLADHEQQPAHDAEALRAAQGLPASRGRSSTRRRLHGGADKPSTWLTRRLRTGRVPLRSGQPVLDLEDRGRVLRRLLSQPPPGCRPCAPASRTSTDRARSSAPGSGAAHRRRSGGTSRRRSSTARSRRSRSSSRTAGAASRDFIYVDDIVRGLLACADEARTGDVYNLASGQRDDDPRAGRDDRRADRETTTPPVVPAAARLGPLRQTVRQHGEVAARARVRRRGRARAGLAGDDTRRAPGSPECAGPP